eukprot:2991757-Amphidinium_carterae.1
MYCCDAQHQKVSWKAHTSSLVVKFASAGSSFHFLTCAAQDRGKQVTKAANRNGKTRLKHSHLSALPYLHAFIMSAKSLRLLSNRTTEAFTGTRCA